MEKYQKFFSEKLDFLVFKFSVYLKRHVFVMKSFSVRVRGTKLEIAQVVSFDKNGGKSTKCIHLHLSSAFSFF